MGLGVSFLGVNETREQYWVTNEENWSVIANQIPDAIVCVEFDCETARVTGKIIIKIEKILKDNK